MIAAEGTTAVTDLALALLAWEGARRLRRVGAPGLLRSTWVSALGVFGAAAALGAAAHGLPWSEATRELLWQPLYLALGVAVALFVTASVAAGWGEGAARRARPWLLALAAGFYLLTRLRDGDFLVFVIYEGAGLLFAFGVHLRLARRAVEGAGWIAAGLAVSLAAGVVQAVDTLTLRLIWTFDHNGVYHLVQGVGLVILLVGLRRMLAAAPRGLAPR